MHVTVQVNLASGSFLSLQFPQHFPNPQEPFQPASYLCTIEHSQARETDRSQMPGAVANERGKALS